MTPADRATEGAPKRVDQTWWAKTGNRLTRFSRGSRGDYRDLRVRGSGHGHHPQYVHDLKPREHPRLCMTSLQVMQLPRGRPAAVALLEPTGLPFNEVCPRLAGRLAEIPQHPAMDIHEPAVAGHRRRGPVQHRAHRPHQRGVVVDVGVCRRQPPHVVVQSKEYWIHGERREVLILKL